MTIYRLPVRKTRPAPKAPLLTRLLVAGAAVAAIRLIAWAFKD